MLMARQMRFELLTPNIERERLTDAIVKRLPRPETGNRIAYDSDVAGFGCRDAPPVNDGIRSADIQTGRPRRPVLRQSGCVG